MPRKRSCSTTSAIFATLILFLFSAPAKAASADISKFPFGCPVREGYVNVTGGEIVRFTVGDKSFAWNFNGRPSSFDLALVAPPGVLDHKVTAYIAPNPLYRRPGR